LVINRFPGTSVQVTGPGRALIDGNFIGVNASGDGALANGTGVAVMDSPHNSIGSGGDLEMRNVIVGGGGGSDIVLDGAGASGNFVEGNFLGTDKTGTVALGTVSSGDGLLIRNGSSTNTILLNIVSGNSANGIEIDSGATTGNSFVGNYIGTDVTSDLPLGNNGQGILVSGSSANTIGGGNVIAGNRLNGIYLAGNANNIQGNFIGTNTNRAMGLGNGNDGIAIVDGAQNRIGAQSSMDNLIADNGGGGVRVFHNDSVGNEIVANDIFNNALLGIDLGGDGVTPNHPTSPTPGPNDFQNYPVLTSAIGGTINGTTVVTLSLTSIPSSLFTLAFYVNTAADPSGYGQGQQFLESLPTVQTDASGNAAFTVFLNEATNPGDWLTATATNQVNGDTSEFSQAIRITKASTSTVLTGSPNPSVFGQQVTFTATVSGATGSGIPAGSVTFMDGTTSIGTVNLSSGTATLTTSSLSNGAHTITANYSGSANFQPSSATLRQAVAPANLLAVAQVLTHSQEHYISFVSGLYVTYLRRAADVPGLTGWVNALYSGQMRDEQVTANFLDSTEYVNNHGGFVLATSQGPYPGAVWITALYQDVLGRAPSTGEVTSWLNVMQSTPLQWTPLQVALSFVSSPENERQNIIDAYMTFLGRAPSDTEVNLYLNAFQNGSPPPSRLPSRTCAVLSSAPKSTISAWQKATQTTPTGFGARFWTSSAVPPAITRSTTSGCRSCRNEEREIVPKLVPIGSKYSGTFQLERSTGDACVRRVPRCNSANTVAPHINTSPMPIGLNSP
jgi:hypothetical protein